MELQISGATSLRSHIMTDSRMEQRASLIELPVHPPAVHNSEAFDYETVDGVRVYVRDFQGTCASTLNRHTNAQQR